MLMLMLIMLLNERRRWYSLQLLLLQQLEAATLVDCGELRLRRRPVIICQSHYDS